MPIPIGLLYAACWKAVSAYKHRNLSRQLEAREIIKRELAHLRRWQEMKRAMDLYIEAEVQRRLGKIDFVSGLLDRALDDMENKAFENSSDDPPTL